ncbi:MAG: hypothetical protein PHR26_00370 [Candidatus ainarchaeum sp.]|nr:hypothetical protein [Candidatus ainarchaeum sp.]MDD3975669.1 hypothetical protein [Candidatus ainarchaeum sp.]
MKFFDIVYKDLIDSSNPKELENIFLKLGFNKIFVIVPIVSKKDIILNPDFSSFKKISLEYIYLIEDISILKDLDKKIILFNPNFSKSNKLTKFLINKNIKYLYNPLSDSLIFDEQCSNLCKINNIKVVFNYNSFRSKNFQKNIKQAQFIILLLKQKLINMYFCSFAKDLNSLCSKQVLFNFLKEFNLDQDILNNILDYNKFVEKYD